MAMFSFFLPFLLLVLVPSSSGKLSFHKDGTFKILHVSDMHYRHNLAFSSCRDVSKEQLKYPCSGHNATRLVRAIRDLERPDLIVFTGDAVDEESIDVWKSLSDVFATAYEAGIPWAYVLGNHDADAGLLLHSRREIVEFASRLPLSMTSPGPVFPDSDAAGNYVLDIHQAASEGKKGFFADEEENDSDDSLFRLILLDSLGFNHKVYLDTVYDFIKPSQVAWVVENGADLPSFVFFHIPLIEYETTLDLPNMTNVIGTKNEKVVGSTINSGLYAALVEQRGRVKAVFVGHNHNNDYCVYKNSLQLCYAGSAGFDSYGKVGWRRRVRVIELKGFGAEAWSWKRINDDAYSVVDKALLFAF